MNAAHPSCTVCNLGPSFTIYPESHVQLHCQRAQLRAPEHGSAVCSLPLACDWQAATSFTTSALGVVWVVAWLYTHFWVDGWGGVWVADQAVALEPCAAVCSLPDVASLGCLQPPGHLLQVAQALTSSSCPEPKAACCILSK